MSDPRDDQLLARILRDEADAVHPSPDWDDVRERAQGRRRWWIPTAAAAVVVLILVAAGVIALGGDDDDRGVIADDPGGTTEPETTTTSEPTTSTTLADASREAGSEFEPLDLPAGEPLAENEIVASITVPNGDDPDAVEVVVLDKESGDVVRTIADGYDIVEGGASGLTLTPDRRTVLYSVSTSACTARIEAAAVDGPGAPVPVADGNQVAVSPDGSHLAIDTGDFCNGPPQIDLLPLPGGQSNRYTGLGAERRTIESMAFADAEQLLYAVRSHVQDEPLTLHSLDLTTGATEVLRPGDGGAEFQSLARHGATVTALESATGRPDHDLVFIEGGEIVDRQPVQITGPRQVQTITPDSTGAIVIAEGFDTLSIDGRVLRDDVLDVAV